MDMGILTCLKKLWSEETPVETTELSRSKMKFCFDDPRKELVYEARKYVGEAEVPVGSNRSVRIDYWNLEAIGDWRKLPMGGEGAPWCGSFVSGAGRQALGHWGTVR